MPSPFQEAAAASSAAIDDVFGEKLMILPMIPGRNKDASPDPSRSALTLTGTYVGKPRDTRINPSHSMGRDLYPDFTGAHITASFDNAAIAGLDIRQNDQLVRLDQPNWPKFEIVAKPIPGPARTRLILAELGS